VNKEQLKYIYTEGEERSLPRMISRDVQVPLGSGKVVVLTGIRRSGKTSLLLEAIGRLLAAGVKRERIVYLNLEDDRIFPVVASELDSILQAHAELHPQLAGEKRYLFLDEVQAVEGWERFVRRVYDGGDWEIYLTGSSSQLLRKDIASPMRGRSLHLEVYPLSFPEFLRFREVEVKTKSRAAEAKVIQCLEAYLEVGGFPEVVLAGAEWRDAILQEYADLILYKDLIEGFGIGNTHVLKLLLKQCMSHPAGFFSPNKFYSTLRSMGVKVSKDTLYTYLDHLEEAFIIFPAQKWDRSMRVRSMNPSKIYVVDTGLAGRFSVTPDRGKRLENAVFHHLRLRERELFYLANGHEVDLASVADCPQAAWNVAWTVHEPETRERETRSLDWARSRYQGIKTSLVCHETPDTWSHDSRLIPAWQLLSGALDQERIAGPDQRI
jgi:predicted AAA+ superfamily ATPase